MKCGLGPAELVYGGWLTIGPPLDDGFYYDMVCAATFLLETAFPC